MKICFVTDNISSYGGQQRVTSVIVNELANIPNLQVSLLFTSPKDYASKLAYEINDNVNLIYTDNYHMENNKFFLNNVFDIINRRILPFNNFDYLKRIYYPKQYLKKFIDFFNINHYDVIIGITPKFAGLVSLLEVDSKKIGWLHSTFERYFEINTEYSNQTILYKRLFSKLDDLVVLTDSSREEFTTKFNIEPTRIYNPISIKSHKISTLESNNILFVGRIFYETKGIDLLLDTMAILLQNTSDIKLHIVGDGPDKQKLFDDIGRLGLDEHIEYHGETLDVSKHYLNSSLLIMPSKMEGFGLVVTEAMHFGLPVVSFETEGPTEIINDGINGYLIPKYDKSQMASKILKIMNDYELRKTLGSNAVIRAKDFSLDKIIQEWIKLFELNK